MEAPRRAPPVRCAVHGLVAVLDPDTIELGCDEIEGAVPTDLDERIAASAVGGGARPTAQPRRPNRRPGDPTLGHGQEPVADRRRIGIGRMAMNAGDSTLGGLDQVWTPVGHEWREGHQGSSLLTGGPTTDGTSWSSPAGIPERR